MKILVLVCEKKPIHASCKLFKIIASNVCVSDTKNHKVSLVAQHQTMQVKTAHVNKIPFFFI